MLISLYFILKNKPNIRIDLPKYKQTAESLNECQQNRKVTFKKKIIFRFCEYLWTGAWSG